MDEVRLVSHSNVIYWWPAWVTGYAVGALNYVQGIPMSGTGGGSPVMVHPSNNPGLFFIAVLMLMIIFTNAKLRGIYSVVTVVSIAFFVVLFAWLGWWDTILTFLPHLSARAGAGFYMVFSTALLVVWLCAFLVFDRITYWKIRPGQMTFESMIGGGERSHDTNGLVFELREQDWFRHVLLGLGAGDLRLMTAGSRQETIEIPNVLFVNRKIKTLQHLVSVKPDQVAATV